MFTLARLLDFQKTKYASLCSCLATPALQKIPSMSFSSMNGTSLWSCFAMW
ncbi:monocyte to macrophage differentiation-associated 2, isoform CRA_a [Mus musculus]|nr:monocyte to macrophage differentiation-associated 2, isoform CRA_a [Mus musculus]